MESVTPSSSAKNTSKRGVSRIRMSELMERRHLLRFKKKRKLVRSRQYSRKTSQRSSGG
jgi:hypothetical protein